MASNPRDDGSGTPDGEEEVSVSVKKSSTGRFAKLISMNDGPNVTLELVNPAMSVVRVKPVKLPPLRKVSPVKSKPLNDPGA